MDRPIWPPIKPPTVAQQAAQAEMDQMMRMIPDPIPEPEDAELTNLPGLALVRDALEQVSRNPAGYAQIWEQVAARYPAAAYYLTDATPEERQLLKQGCSWDELQRRNSTDRSSLID